VQVDDALYLLSEAEIAAVKKRERIAISLSAFIGAMGVILLYVPYYIAPEWFPETVIRIAGRQFSLPLVFGAYSMLLVGIELFLLAMLNIWCAHEVAVATGFLDYESKAHPSKQNLLVDIGMEKKNKKVLQYGIDPLLGLNRRVLLLWNLLFILKATLTNFLFRFLIQRVAGRHLIRAIQDFAGIPIFAFWNAFGTRILLREARIIIMGQNLVEVFMNRMRHIAQPVGPEKELYADTMQFIAVNKRDFHQNHFLLTRNVFEMLGIEARQGAWDVSGYLERLASAPAEIREHCVSLIIVGLVLDAKISGRERARITDLHRRGLLQYDVAELQRMTRDFTEGRGIPLPDFGLSHTPGASPV
jgi:hypothetical protein